MPASIQPQQLNQILRIRQVGGFGGGCGDGLDELYPGSQDFFDEGILWCEVLGGEGDGLRFEFTADGKRNRTDFVFVVHTVADEDVGDQGHVNIAPFVGISPRVTAKEDGFLDGDVTLL